MARHTRSATAHGAEGLPRVVIVGGGFGGLAAARALGKAPVALTLVDRRNHHLFQPLLYQVATADLSPAQISAPIRAVLNRQRRTRVVLAEVAGITVAERTLLLRDPVNGRERTLEYDYLVLATGAGPSYFGHDDWAQHARGLKTIADATEIRRRILLAFEEAEMETDPARIHDLLTFVIVGGGPTGVELAGAIAELAHKTILRDFRNINAATARVLLVEAGPRLLTGFPERLARRARARLERLGVEVCTGAAVEQVDAQGVVVHGERVASQTVLWAAGVQASPVAAWLGASADRAGRVLVEPDLSVPGHPEIFVLGDTAHVEHKGTLLPGVAPVAMQQGRYVAQALRARLAGQTPAPFRYHDKGNLATVGRSFAIADLGWLRLSGFAAWVTWLVVHIFYLIGFRNRVLVMLQWAWTYVTYQRGARLIIQAESYAHERESVHTR